MQGLTARQKSDMDNLYAHAVPGGIPAIWLVDHSVSGQQLSVTVNGQLLEGVTAYGWGNHADAHYLQTETDPAFHASAAATITALMVAAWNAMAANRLLRDYQTGVVGGTLTLPSAPVAGSDVLIFKNLGLLREGVTGDFTVAGAVVTLGVPLIAADEIDVFYTG